MTVKPRVVSWGNVFVTPRYARAADVFVENMSKNDAHANVFYQAMCVLRDECMKLGVQYNIERIKKEEEPIEKPELEKEIPKQRVAKASRKKHSTKKKSKEVG